MLRAGIALIVACAVPAVADAGGPIQVTTSGGRHPSVSSDGLWIVYAVPSGGIEKVSASGGTPTPLSAFGREPDWARGGNLVVFRSNDSLYTVNATGGQPTYFTHDGGFDDNPVWSPDGTEIAVQSSSSSIVIIAYPSGSTSTVTCSDPDVSQCDGEHPTWSPAGTDLAFEDGLQILKVARSGGVASTIVDEPQDVSDPAWSPDGSWIAFSKADANDPNAINIWVADARGASLGLWPVTTGAFIEGAAAWSPESDTIYFESDRSGQTEIWRVSFTPTAAPPSSWTSIKTLFR